MSPARIGPGMCYIWNEEEVLDAACVFRWLLFSGSRELSLSESPCGAVVSFLCTVCVVCPGDNNLCLQFFWCLLCCIADEPGFVVQCITDWSSYIHREWSNLSLQPTWMREIISVLLDTVHFNKSIAVTFGLIVDGYVIGQYKIKSPPSLLFNG